MISEQPKKDQVSNIAEIMASRVNKIKVNAQPILAEMMYRAAGLTDEQIFEEREVAGQKVKKIKSDLLMSLMLQKISEPGDEDVEFGRVAGQMIDRQDELAKERGLESCLVELMTADDYESQYAEMAELMLTHPKIQLIIGKLRSEKGSAGEVPAIAEVA